MNLADEDWLSDEKFDFDLNLSKSSVEILDGNDDDELRVDGPQNKGTEFRSGSSSEEWLLKDSALIAMRIKSRGTPGLGNTASNTKSPVAVVHPMRRDDINLSTCHDENKENIPNPNSNDAGIGMATLSLSAAKLDVIQMEIPSNINTHKKSGRFSGPHKPSGNPIGLVEPFSADQKLKENGKEKLEAPKINANSLKIKQTNLENPTTKISSQNAKTAGFAEPLGNESQSMSEAVTKIENAGLQSRLKKPLMITKPGSVSKSKSGGGIPSSQPSALPNKLRKQDAGASGTKPVKARSQSSGISQPREKSSQVSQLKLSGRKCVSAGTPESSSKIGLNSAKKQSSIRKKLTASSSVDTPLDPKKTIKPPKSAAKQNCLITPGVKPPRKSIVCRKLNPANDESSKTVLDGDVVQSLLNVDTQVEGLEPSNDIVFEENSKYISEPGVAVDDSCSTIETAVKDSDITCDPKFLEISKSSDINAVLDKTVVSDPCVVETSEVDNTENPVINDNSAECIEKTETELLAQMHISSSAVGSPAPLLIDILCSDSALSPIKVNAMDPFTTGNTPPPLIQLDMILEPERPPELNLIEF